MARKLSVSLALLTVLVLVAVGNSSASRQSSVVTFSFSAYAHNVRVLPPLIGSFQLGVVRMHGAGKITAGTITGSIYDDDYPKAGGHRWLRGTVLGGSWSERIGAHSSGRVATMDIRFQIRATSNPTQECAPGLVGSLKLQDSSYKLGNGQRQDYVVSSFSKEPGKLCGHVHGFGNTDGGPRTSPQSGGPPHGGQWAIVTITVKPA